MEKEKSIIKLFKESIKNKRTWIPNLLTTSRLFGTFVIPSLFFSANYIGTIIAIAFFSLTDFFDGKIARKFNGYSEFGKILDPIVDKIFAVGLTIAIIPSTPILIINLIPELAIATINYKSYANNGKPQSSIFGKIKTHFLFSTIGLGYISLAANLEILNIILALACTSTFALQSLATYDYYKKSKKENIENENLEINKEENNENDNQKEKQLDGKNLNIGLTRKEVIELLKEEKENLTRKPKEEKEKIKTLKK